MALAKFGNLNATVAIKDCEKTSILAVYIFVANVGIFH